MRYAAQRIRTGEWLHQNLPLSGVERTRVLSGPSTITATIQPEMRDAFAVDGMRVLEEWGTYVYAINDNNRITHGGLVVDVSYGESENDLRLTIAGVTAYPRGEIYDDSRLWGPQVGKGTIAQPETPRPDPVVIVQDLWDWLQEQPNSDLGVTLIGSLESKATVGDYEEPYRLRWWELPDIGAEIDELAESTPFDYVEEHMWGGDGEPRRRVRLGYPRMGRRRDDLRFALGENVTLNVSAGETGSEYANKIIGIGNGEGRKMVRADSVVDDGRLQRTSVYTDKSIKNQDRLARRVRNLRERMAETLDVSSIAIRDHPNAPINAIEVGDDILLHTTIRPLGRVQIWLRVLSITEGDNPDVAALSTKRSTAFIYPGDLDQRSPEDPEPDDDPTAPLLRVAVVNANSADGRRALIRKVATDADVLLIQEAGDFILNDVLGDGWGVYQTTGGRARDDKPQEPAQAATAVAVRTSKVGTVLGDGLAPMPGRRWCRWVEVRDTVGNRVRYISAQYPRREDKSVQREYTSALRTVVVEGGLRGAVVIGADVRQPVKHAAQRLDVRNHGRRQTLLGTKGARATRVKVVTPEGTDEHVITANVRLREAASG